MILAVLFVISILLSVVGNLLSGAPMFGVDLATFAQLSQPDSVVEVKDDGFGSNVPILSGIINFVNVVFVGVRFATNFFADLLGALYWGPNQTMLSNPFFILIKLPFWGLSLWGFLSAVLWFRGRG